MSTEIKVMPSGKYAGTPINKLEGTYLIYTLDNTNLVPELRKALLKELYNRYFA